MQTILISSQKGGSGKTTLAAHLSVAATAAGAEAWLVDTDKQGTLARWHERREAEEPGRLDMPLAQIPAGLDMLAGQGARYCLIDSAPTISADNRKLLELADLVLIPVKPSPADLWAVAATVELAQRAGVDFLFVLTQTKARAAITGQAAAALSAHGRVAQSFIGDRVAFASAMVDGRTAQELAPSSPAAREIAALWAEIETTLQGGRA